MPAAAFTTLTAAYALLWPALLFVEVRRKWEVRALSSALNLMVLALVCFQLAWIGSFEWRRLHTVLPPRPATTWISCAPSAPQARPNIYFIVLDGYAREDVMRELYGYDNRPFLRALEAAGFQVAHHARTNYCQTVLSLGSCLNLGYLDSLCRAMGPMATDRTPLAQAIDRNETTRFLRSRGYRIVAFASGYDGTAMQSADVYRRGLAGVSEFQSTLLQSTPLIFLGRAVGLFDETPAHRQARHVLYTLEHLPEAGRSPTPVFVFAHIIAPHPPFMFCADGSIREDADSTGFEDGQTVCGSPRRYVREYRAQAEFISQRMPQVIKEILARAPRPTAIILLSDHGPGSTLDFNHMHTMLLKERFGNLLALRLPGQPSVHLPDDASTVNMCRLVLHACFGANLPPLPSASYASNFELPYRLTRLDYDKGKFAWPKENSPTP